MVDTKKALAVYIIAIRFIEIAQSCASMCLYLFWQCVKKDGTLYGDFMIGKSRAYLGVLCYSFSATRFVVYALILLFRLHIKHSWIFFIQSISMALMGWNWLELVQSSAFDDDKNFSFLKTVIEQDKSRFVPDVNAINEWNLNISLITSAIVTYVILHSLQFIKECADIRHRDKDSDFSMSAMFVDVNMRQISTNVFDLFRMYVVMGITLHLLSATTVLNGTRGVAIVGGMVALMLCAFHHLLEMTQLFMNTPEKKNREFRLQITVLVSKIILLIIILYFFGKLEAIKPMIKHTHLLQIWKNQNSAEFYMLLIHNGLILCVSNLELVVSTVFDLKIRDILKTKND